MKSYPCPVCQAERKANGLHGHLSLDHAVPWTDAPGLSKSYRQAVDSGDEEAIKAAVQQIREAAGVEIPGSPAKLAEPGKAERFRAQQAEFAASMAINHDTEAGDDRADARDTPAPAELCQAATEFEAPVSAQPAPAELVTEEEEPAALEPAWDDEDEEPAGAELESPEVGGTEPKGKNWGWMDVAGIAATVAFGALLLYAEWQGSKRTGPSTFQPVKI